MKRTRRNFTEQEKVPASAETVSVEPNYLRLARIRRNIDEVMTKRPAGSKRIVVENIKDEETAGIKIL